ncbi:MAG: hypothetical protein M3365_12470, partial [Gemmatimonadota bacterium]|nr:hypothetical protein [Gemmatimonadota bacterium]
PGPHARRFRGPRRRTALLEGADATGAPLAFGVLNGIPWIGMSGNPVSAMVSFELFVRPALRKMQGHASLFRRVVSVTTDEEVKISAKLTHFLRAVVTRQENGGLRARLAGAQSSGALTSMARANALLIVPGTQQTVPKGVSLNAMMLDQSLDEETVFRL